MPNALLPALFGIGTGGNIMGDIQKMIEQKRLADYQKSVMNMSPQTVAKNAASMAAPLSHGLTQAVGNQVQGSLAERGLSQAPGIYAGELSQSLAPYVQQNLNTALQAYLQKLQIPLESTPPSNLYAGNQDMTNLMKLWLQQKQGGGGGGSFPGGDFWGSPPPSVDSSGGGGGFDVLGGESFL